MPGQFHLLLITMIFATIIAKKRDSLFSVILKSAICNLQFAICNL